MNTKKVIAGAIPQKLTADPAPNKVLKVRNYDSAHSAFIGREGVSAADGFEILPNTSEEFKLGSSSHVFVASDVVAAPAAAPTTATATTGGTIPAGTHNVKETYVNAAGETTPGASAARTTTGATSTLTVTGAALPSGVTAAKVYIQIGQTGAYKYAGQRTSGTDTVLTAPPAGNAAVAPTVNTAGLTAQVRCFEG